MEPSFYREAVPSRSPGFASTLGTGVPNGFNPDGVASRVATLRVDFADNEGPGVAATATPVSGTQPLRGKLPINVIRIQAWQSLRGPYRIQQSFARRCLLPIAGARVPNLARLSTTIPTLRKRVPLSVQHLSWLLISTLPK